MKRIYTSLLLATTLFTLTINSALGSCTDETCTEVCQKNKPKPPTWNGKFIEKGINYLSPTQRHGPVSICSCTDSKLYRANTLVVVDKNCTPLSWNANLNQYEAADEWVNVSPPSSRSSSPGPKQEGMPLKTLSKKSS